MEEDLLKIIKHYGIDKQLKYIHSEYFELDEAIIDYKYVECYKDSPAEIFQKQHIAEEIADVLVMLNQFIEYFELDKEEITEICEYKIQRQLERIENEK